MPRRFSNLAADIVESPLALACTVWGAILALHVVGLLVMSHLF